MDVLVAGENKQQGNRAAEQQSNRATEQSGMKNPGECCMVGAPRRRYRGDRRVAAKDLKLRLLLVASVASIALFF
jgi:hypothetical protein